MAILGYPILGDEKYPSGTEIPEGIDQMLHLHARRICFPHPSGEGVVDVTAPLPPHMEKAFNLFGFSVKGGEQEEPDDEG
jgi:23S rRNA pseudouridine955/2504/2580 synthase